MKGMDKEVDVEKSMENFTKNVSRERRRVTDEEIEKGKVGLPSWLHPRHIIICEQNEH